MVFGGWNGVTETGATLAWAPGSAQWTTLSESGPRARSNAAFAVVELVVEILAVEILDLRILRPPVAHDITRVAALRIARTTATKTPRPTTTTGA